MKLFQYFAVTTACNGGAFGFVFEHEATDIDALAEELSEAGLITVDKVKSVDDGQGGRLITGRDRTIIGAASVATIALATTRHWEAPQQQQAA